MDWARIIKGFLLSFVFVAVFLYAISGLNFFLSFLPEKNTADISNAAKNVFADNNRPAGEQPAQEIQPIPAPAINSEAAISAESNLENEDRIIYEKNSDEKLPIASLTKLMTAVIVLDNPKVYDFSKNITVGSDADLQDPLKIDLKLGDTMSVENFFDVMLIESSNKAAYALSEVMSEPVFLELMNRKAQEIGLKNTFFADPTGLSPKNVSTANDLTKLAEYILKNYPKISQISSIKSLVVPELGSITNSDELLGQVPEIVCGKTGFTTQAKGCLLLVTSNKKNNDNDYIINVILGADDRFSEMKKLLVYGQSKICN